jgi:hypothetical protein
LVSFLVSMHCTRLLAVLGTGFDSRRLHLKALEVRGLSLVRSTSQFRQPPPLGVEVRHDAPVPFIVRELSTMRLAIVTTAIAAASMTACAPRAVSPDTPSGDNPANGPALPPSQAEERLRRHAPGVAWRTDLQVDLDGDGVTDLACLGTTDSEAVVAFVLGASTDPPQVSKFRNDSTRQAGICDDPQGARISVEALPGLGDPDAPLSALAATGPVGRRGVRMDSGDCDAIHFYFDGKTVTWWRR